jgi:hypothetical protein
MKRFLVVAAAVYAVVTWAVSLTAQSPAPDGPRYAASGELVRPTDYRDWVYLSSGLNMTYGANAPNPARNQPFNNVFVNRAAYRQFLESGKWPEKTIFILEVRSSEEHIRPNAFGFTQAGVNGMEAAVKDSSRQPGQPWAYYSFDSATGLTASAKPLPTTASCQTCHSQHGAVEQTFVQFYPTLYDVAKAKGTVRADWNPRIEPQAPSNR